MNHSDKHRDEAQNPLRASTPVFGSQSSPAVYLERLEDSYATVVESGLEWTSFFRNVPSGSTVFLKPNLTFPTYHPGVMTSFECLKAVTGVLVEKGYKVIIGEADSGGYNRFSIDEVFRKMGIQQLAKEAGARIVNISFTEAEIIRIRKGFRRLSIPLPRLLLNEIDAFITLPVPKIHMNTLVSMSIKNQWGCIQEPSERLKLHPYFAEVIFEVCKRLPNAYSIIDGRYGLNGSGPMRGDPIRLDWLIVANDLVAADRVCCRLMQIDERHVRYLEYFKSRGWWVPYEEVRLNQAIEPFLKEKFYLRRAWTDLPGLACFNSSFLAWLGYRSPLASLLHWLLYLFREPFYDYDSEKKRVREK
ncbi:MAG: DUF362 domain-containing protein [Verrucomicrobia bacterium]|nr:DUF362 domain-containing protein [Verrucomicrobiota bacterium]